MKRISHIVLAGLLSCGMLLSISPAVSAQTATERPAGWTEASHSNNVDPNYEVVFPDDQVNVITITIDPENWEAMQANMTELFGAPGSRNSRAGFGGGPMRDPAREPAQPNSPLAPPADGQPISPLAPPAEMGAGADMPGPPPGFGFDGDFSSEKPMWVTATLEFDGNVWTNIGVRYKGNSSLRSAWDSQTHKLPFKLDFDQFEDEYPEIHNQRFYGFKQLSLANGFGDVTFMRDAITYDLLEDAGLVAAQTAFYEIHLDYGEGPVNLGLYTAIEVIDDTVIEGYFGDDKGNIYEGDGRGVSLAEGTFDLIESSFEKENNDGEDEADWSDIEALYEVLHDESRLEDPETWRANLEAVFDVDTFLRWLALSATIQHWDTYGAMTHNFYLYHDPETDQLVWISWDHNFVLGASAGGGMGGGMGMGAGAGMQAPPTGGRDQQGAQGDGFAGRQGGQGGGFGGRQQGGAPGGGGRGGGPGGGREVTFDKANVTDSWPLIRYLLDDPVYAAQYNDELSMISSDVFDVEALTEQYETWAELLTPYVENEDTFELSVTSLISATQQQAEKLTSYLLELAEADSSN